MPVDRNLHGDRNRAESFGSVAEQYDRFRPSYPDQLISDLLGLNPERTLDVACGTGKVAVPLLACGLAVLGVEIDEKMADVARRHGIIVEIGKFETWDDKGRTFDLITCGQGWHWIDPDQGARKAFKVLNPGGTAALFWNYGDVSGELKHDLDAVYQKLAPGIMSDAAHHRHEDEPYAETLRQAGFSSVRTETYRWSAALETDEWVSRIATHSDHIALPDEQRTELLEAVRSTVDEHTGYVEVESGTYTIFARVPETK